MKWNRFTIKTKTEAEDVIISALADVGVEGVEIQDKQPLTETDKEQMFVDIMPEGPVDDGIAYLNFYLEEDTETTPVLERVRAVLEEVRGYMDIGEGTITESQTEDKDWINNWKEYFHQFYVDDILIVPSWEEVKEEDKDKMILHIDPGTAFGTGMHETTQLVIRQLKKFVTKDTQMLDVGTGSGILGIVALKLGAAHVVGTDLDPCAIPAVADNKEANDIKDETFDMLIGNIIDDKEVQDTVGYEKYDIVTANILADVLVPLTPVIVNQMKKGAYYITSGILDVKEEVVVKAVKDAGLQLVEVTHQGEWVSVTARKGTDLDPCAIPAVADNKEANDIKDETFDMLIGNIIDDKEVQDTVGYEKYDIVTANILADVLVPLTPVIVNQMKKGAYYITSGILDVKEEVVVKAVKDAGLQLVEVTHQGEWVSVTARKE